MYLKWKLGSFWSSWEETVNEFCETRGGSINFLRGFTTPQDEEEGFCRLVTDKCGLDDPSDQGSK